MRSGKVVIVGITSDRGYSTLMPFGRRSGVGIARARREDARKVAEKVDKTAAPPAQEPTPKYEEEIVLADDQRAELREAFGLFEKAGKGRISVRDLGALLRSLGMNPSERDLEEARHELEVSGTFSRARGTVAFADVERYIARRGGVFLGCDEEEDIHAAFQVLDRNGNGRIDVDEFRHFMTTMGERMTSEEVEELLSVAKKDGESFIEYKDIVRALQSGNT